MIISASTRPRNLRRGVSMKKFCKALGFKDEVGLTEMCGRLELSAETPSEFGIVTALYKALLPCREHATKITIEIDGKPYCEFTRGPNEKR